LSTGFILKKTQSVIRKLKPHRIQPLWSFMSISNRESELSGPHGLSLALR